MRLLIVDDNLVNIRLLRAQLETEGHEVIDASNGADALRRLRTDRVEGVISDILMPEMDGYRFCLEVRKDPGLCGLPFVLYTSTYNSPADRQLALKVGADAYISKPAPTMVILDALREAAGRKRQAPSPEESRNGETDVLKKYSEVLVRKLEDKNLELEKSLAHLSMTRDIDRAITSASTPTQVAEAVLPRLRDLLGLPRVIVNMFDLKRNEAEWLVAVGRHRSHVGPGVRYSMELMGDLDGLKRGEMQLVDVEALRQRPEAEALLASGVRWFMVAPMIVGDELIGGLSFGGASREFPEEMLQTAQQIATQLAIALAQVRLDARVKRADAHYRAIFENAPVSITMTTVEGEFLSVNPAFARFFGYLSTAEAMAADLRAAEVYADAGAREEYLRRLHSDGAVTEFEAQFRRSDGALVWGSMSGRPVNDPTGEHSLLLTMISDITHRKEQEHRIARLSRVKAMQSSINSAVARIHERPALLDEVCRIAVDQGGIRAAWVGWHDVENQLLRPVASSGLFDGFLKLVSLSTDLPPEKVESPAVRALQSGKSHVNNDIRTSAGLVFAAQAAKRGYRSMMQLPLKVDGHPQGVLVLYAPEVGFFDDEETKLLEELAADVSFALDSLQKSERLNYLAFYDPLTSLPNRSLFHDRLSHSLNLRGGDARLIAVVLLDLERFRRVNETLGRQSGDEVLREAGARLQKAHDSAARIGADVYGLVLRGARAASEVNRTIESILEACFTQAVPLHGDNFRISCRAGVALHPEDGADADVLLRNAEAALRRSKNSGERVVFYAAEMNAQVAEALSTENKLRRAIERREFVLHYQPKVALNDGRIVGAEALIRWQDPDKGLVPPGRFIPILEETGLIIEVGRWALEQTFVDLDAWSRKGLQPLRVAVNVSSMQLQRRDFVDTVIEEIANGGDRPDWLELEITESLVMRNVEDSTRKLSILRGMGVTVAIDDFGTGYSSLSYLSRLPVDALKIDRSFVQGVVSGGDSQTLVSTIVTLAHGLSLKVVAEGVETEAQAEKLRRYSCDQAQGYLYSKAVPAADFERLLLLPGARLPAAG